MSINVSVEKKLLPEKQYNLEYARGNPGLYQFIGHSDKFLVVISVNFYWVVATGEDELGNGFDQHLQIQKFTLYFGELKFSIKNS